MIPVPARQLPNLEFDSAKMVVSGRLFYDDFGKEALAGGVEIGRFYARLKSEGKAKAKFYKS